MNTGPDSTAPLAAHLRDLAVRGELRELLRRLNARTRHRYTGVYRFDPPMLRSVVLVDRENPDLVVGDDCPIDETYCGIVGRLEAAFATADAQQDGRLRTHPARASVLAYCGVPLCTPSGRCVGTLCHFDVRPRLVPEAELTLMRAVATAVLASCTATGMIAVGA